MHPACRIYVSYPLWSKSQSKTDVQEVIMRWLELDWGTYHYLHRSKWTCWSLLHRTLWTTTRKLDYLCGNWEILHFNSLSDSRGSVRYYSLCSTMNSSGTCMYVSSLIQGMFSFFLFLSTLGKSQEVALCGQIYQTALLWWWGWNRRWWWFINFSALWEQCIYDFLFLWFLTIYIHIFWESTPWFVYFTITYKSIM